MAQARSISNALGIRDLAIAEYPGVMSADSEETFREKMVGSVVEQIVEGLPTQPQAVARQKEPDLKDIVFTGTLDDVLEHFHKNLWTDGLPIVPPTRERVEQFLRFTDRSLDEVLGVLLPEQREATIWNVAVNGVMAGCRPEYMPILISIAEAIADPVYAIQDGGSTPSHEPLVILSGPLAKELDFNYGQGIMKVGRQANTSVGRFTRLFYRNGAGLRIPPGTTDKGTIGHTFLTVLAEDEDAVTSLGWDPYRVDQGFHREDNAVTVMSVLIISPLMFPGTSKGADTVETLIRDFGLNFLRHNVHWLHFGPMYSVVIMTPIVAQVLARDGWTKPAIKKAFYDRVRVPASEIDGRGGANDDRSLRRNVERGILPKEYALSDDPERLVPVIVGPERGLGIVVAGDPARERMKGYVNQHWIGSPVSKKVALPARWKDLLRSARK